ncbi:MAG: IS3 family transposase [Candidatus Atribacteria bacterium]|nr:IS3 family transposase [Candidatus Atribacteria bacterium]
MSHKHPYYGYRRITAQLRRDKVIVNHNLLNLPLLL